MNPSSDLENLLRSLTPGELPDDLRERLIDGPANPRTPKPLRRWFLRIGAPLAAAATLAVMIRPSRPPAPAPPVSVHHIDSELIRSTRLGVVEENGRFYQVEERVWRDDESAVCSGTPVRINLGADRRELVYQPVRFD